MGVDTIDGRYVLDGHLGQGGMGCVYRARHVQLGKTFALKLISPAFALDHEARARFNEEAKLASAISHPNIVSVVDFGEDQKFGAYMVMELIEGEPLMDGTGPQPVRRVCDVLAQIADALEHIHRRGIVHGDVKADNVMLTAETTGARRRRTVRLLDFGLARRRATDAQLREDRISGSPPYLAPERAAGGPPSVLADLYALGVIGYLMLTGAVPFEGAVMDVLMKHIHAAPPPIAERRGQAIDPALDTLVMRALAKDPAQRHASAAAFRYELNNVMDMLALSPRKRVSAPIRAIENPRELAAVTAFESSALPQALVSADGVIACANGAFAKLVGATGDIEAMNIVETSLAEAVPGLFRALRTVHASGKPQERRAHVDRSPEPPLQLTVWMYKLPLAGQEIHMLVHVDEMTA